MTVGELIERLKEMPQDAVVWYSGEDGRGWPQYHLADVSLDYELVSDETPSGTRWRPDCVVFGIDALK